MKKPFFAAVVAAAVAPLGAAAQQTPVASPQVSVTNIPAFEVVSVKVNRSGAEAQSMRLQPGGRAVITNSPIRPVIQLAYALLPQQLVGGPSWLDSDRFDIVAQARENLEASPPDGTPGKAQLMLQRLLAERFGLVVHTESREQPIYVLTVARDDGRLGPGTAPAKADCMALMAAYGRGEAPMPPRSECGIAGGPPRLSARGVSMPMFARTVLAGLTDRIVEDRTGLTAFFDLDLEFTPGSGVALHRYRGAARVEVARRTRTGRRSSDRSGGAPDRELTPGGHLEYGFCRCPAGVPDGSDRPDHDLDRAMAPR